ncbi:hypothetical protein [Limnohabitans sp.]
MSTKQKITPAELVRAIFVDYEGNIDRHPTLLGWRIDGKTHGAIVEETFSTCSNRYRAKEVAFQPHHQLAKNLLAQACDEDRVIVSWSEHDLKLLKAVIPQKEHSYLHGRYRNAIPTAKSWYRQSMQERSPQGDLAFFCQLLGFPIPLRFGTGKVGQGLRLLRGQLQEGRLYSELTPKARASWVVVVKHNDLDLRAMEYVLKVIMQVPMGRSHPDQMALTFVHSDQ